MDEILDTSTKIIGGSNLLTQYSFIGSPRYVETKPLTKKEIREALMLEIYNFYVSEKDKRKKENWNRYCKWCKSNYKANTPENIKAFKRTKMYIREISFESLKWLLHHIPTEDLTYFTSTGKEFKHQNKNFSSWLSVWFPKRV